jgi:hypothetical protein
VVDSAGELASVSTRVVSWNEAAEMKLSVESEAWVMPRRVGGLRKVQGCRIRRSRQIFRARYSSTSR